MLLANGANDEKVKSDFNKDMLVDRILCMYLIVVNLNTCYPK